MQVCFFCLKASKNRSKEKGEGQEVSYRHTGMGGQEPDVAAQDVAVLSSQLACVFPWHFCKKSQIHSPRATFQGILLNCSKFLFRSLPLLNPEGLKCPVSL